MNACRSVNFPAKFGGRAVFVIALINFTILPSLAQVRRPVERTAMRLGFTPFPADASLAAVADAFRFIGAHGDLVSYSFQNGIPWPQALSSADLTTYPDNFRQYTRLLLENQQSFIPNHRRYVAFNPISADYRGLAPLWGETASNLPLTAPWNTYAFNDWHVEKAALNFAIALIETFKPSYFCIGVEVNILLVRRSDLWSSYKELNQYLYGALKSIYPDLPVFVSFQYEQLAGLIAESADFQQSVSAVYPNVLVTEALNTVQFSDAFAISTYPFTAGVVTIPDGYYDLALSVAAQANRPMAVEQGGFSSEPVSVNSLSLPGSESAQLEFIQILLDLARTRRFLFVVNFIAIDYGPTVASDPTAAVWAYTGLSGADGPKPALAVWDQALHFGR